MSGDLWVPGDDPWKEAWLKLKAYIDAGATPEDITAYARELGEQLQGGHPDTAACFVAMADVIRDIETS